MAAFAISAYKVNNSSDKVDHQQAHTSLWALLRGAPRTGGKGLKATFVTITHNTDGAYATGGVAVDLLSNLPGWTSILACVGVPIYNTTSTAAWERPEAVAFNDATTGNRKIRFYDMTTGAEITNTRVMGAGTFELLVLGY